MTDYEAVILDVDGTIVRGEALLPGVTDGLRALEAAGCSRLLFSNNPTRGADHYGGKLAPHGIDVDPGSVLTSRRCRRSTSRRPTPTSRSTSSAGSDSGPSSPTRPST